ncbi:SpaH/EbpB family LPXTG-anchored major pilin [Lactococcus cremoris]|jgi:fimbrial isopeptide formation D2 family protein/LPXTG-motif cell wall-anchored protein|uniref:Gram-positive cocci surface proteins LPxTG domain-containing protein n=1 Tax=Lactococcus cremoris subsp. cremoris IBB477 TaxID=1449093 RepID=A0A1E7G4I2_LACLC|nr:SpaH/EbpB family LPXTG-anchored major pilin [Lactococcus cremoris]MCI1840645.1 SpaH/EbpB family LPXTG-anchored major pilin [Lactococcus lactis]KZK10827.1 Cell wall surface anchor family protein [Lactococcus cremoris]MCT0455027.1 isopeptide-forming domain-containing fimbrial protein [Lactococcus cremoris]MCT0474260.1 isopeptide-forming domain-containing fimbrial protein [Lactococcus cremoris]MCT0476820.1 isopeptide-forming domain-containing fimbrial protein [Lactococcus cremoris]
MKKIKVFALLATLFVGIFSNLFTPVVSAEDTSNSATVTIHKLKNKTGPIVNTGKELSGLNASDFLDGITFNVYDVTAAYHTKYNEVYTSKTAQDADDAARTYVQGTTAGHAPTVVQGATLVATKTTAGGGAATFTLPKKSDGKDAVYVFVEQPKTSISKAENNLVLSFPVYQLNDDGTYTDTELSRIHLYPKNTTEDITPVKDITTPNTDAAGHNNYNVGKEIGFKLSTPIPANIGIKEVDGATPHYNTFGLIDTHDTTLTFNPAGTHELKVAGTTIVLTEGELADYTIVVGEPTPAEGKATFKVKLTQAGINKLAEEGGKNLEFTYTMKLNDTAVMDSKNVNKVTVEYGRKTDTFNDVVTTPGNEKEVYTGGYRFIKTDVSTNKPLVNAEFVVRDAATKGQYLKIDDTTKEISWVDTYEEATKFTTGADGIVDIKGLTYDTYYLEETQAPTDYVKLSARIAFTVEFGSYTAHTTTTTTKVLEHSVANTPKGFLPSTGGAGIILFVALGVAMVGLAGVYFTSRRKND